MKKEMSIVDLIQNLERKIYDENLSEHKRNIAKAQLDILSELIKQNTEEV